MRIRFKAVLIHIDRNIIKQLRGFESNDFQKEGIDPTTEKPSHFQHTKLTNSVHGDI